MASGLGLRASGAWQKPGKSNETMNCSWASTSRVDTSQGAPEEREAVGLGIEVGMRMVSTRGLGAPAPEHLPPPPETHFSLLRAQNGRPG